MQNRRLLNLSQFMKTSGAALIVVLFLLLNFINTNAQAQNAELEKLEAQLKQLEEESGAVEVDVDRDGENSGTITFEVKRKVPVAATNKSNDGLGITKTKTEKVSLPTIDLSRINVSNEDVNKQIDTVFSRTARCGVLPAVNVVHLDASRYWMVTADYIYDSGAYKITVPKEFVYDRASIPSVFWSFGLDKDSLGNVAPLIHDLLYRTEGELPANLIEPSNKKFSRKEADKLFLEMMRQCGVTKGRRVLAYQAVRTFSRFAWKKRLPLINRQETAQYNSNFGVTNFF